MDSYTVRVGLGWDQFSYYDLIYTMLQIIDYISNLRCSISLGHTWTRQAHRPVAPVSIPFTVVPVSLRMLFIPSSVMVEGILDTMIVTVCGASGHHLLPHSRQIDGLEIDSDILGNYNIWSEM